MRVYETGMRATFRPVRQRVVLMVSIVAATTALPATASASSVKQYVLKRPKREHCEAHYVKKVGRVKVQRRQVKETVCVYVAPKAVTPTAPTTVPTTTSAPTPGQGTTGGETVIYGLISAARPLGYPCERCSPPANLPLPVSVSDPGVVTVTNRSTGAQVEQQKVAAGSAGFRVIVPAGAYLFSAIDEAVPTAYCPVFTLEVTEGEQINQDIDCEAP